MKPSIVISSIVIGFSSLLTVPTASADQLAACRAEVSSETCQLYLEGVVDGALMYKPRAIGERLTAADYESRALKYRGGKRFQQANMAYCADRIPERTALVEGLGEAVFQHQIIDTDRLTEVMQNLLDCQRKK